MEMYKDEYKKTPKEVHDELAEKLGGINSPQYRNFSERARKAAEHIKKNLKLTHKDIKHVRWTSKSGDLERATGIPATQQQDDSDIVITDHRGRHHGVSLKVSDDNKPITLANAGAEATYGGGDIHEKNRSAIKESYPELKGMSNPRNRKDWLKSNPAIKQDISRRNLATLTDVARNMHQRISALTPEQRAAHIRHLVLHAYSTPMEAHGHTHMRHFTGGGHDPHLETANPGLDHEHILNDPENISVRHAGTSIYYEHKGVPFAMQTAKMSSQSDPLSSLVVTGKEVKRKKDKPAVAAPVAPSREVTSRDIEAAVPKVRSKKVVAMPAAKAPRAKAAPVSTWKPPKPTKHKKIAKTVEQPIQVHPDEERAASEGMGGAISRTPQRKAPQPRKPRPNIPIGNDGTHGGVVF